MTNRLKKDYINVLRERYKKAKKREKTQLLDIICDNGKIHRKYANRVLNGVCELPKSKRGRKPRYSPECLYHLKNLFKSMNYVCAVKMKAAIPYWISYYEDEFLTEEIKTQLLEMSASTIERFLKGHKARLRRYANGGTVSTQSYMKRKIPIRDINYNITEPGHFEADTVAHCGNSLLGSFVWSVTMTDIYSGWTENRAIWNKGSHGVMEAVKSIEHSLVLDFKSLHTDNGSEFLAGALDRYINDYSRTRKIKWTRSRPKRSNDACHVEQKNWTHVRETFGYERYNKYEHVFAMNDIYENEQRLLYNFFIPTLKLKSKTRIGSRYSRIYSKPQTPYQRLMESEAVTLDQKERLQRIYKNLNPFKLRANLARKINKLLKEVVEESPSVKTNKLAS